MAVSIDATSTRVDRQLALLVADLVRRVDATERAANTGSVAAAVLTSNPDFADLVSRIERLEAAVLSGGSPP